MPRQFSTPRFLAKMLLGRKINAWRVLAITDHLDRQHHPFLQCRCVCGREREVSQYALITDQKRSCGCLDPLFDRLPTRREVKAPPTVRHRKEYSTWKNILTRCHNPESKRYPNYGGRGIRVAPQWRDSFSTFLQDIGAAPGPEFSLDRINNNGNYEPGNVRWAMWEEQARNRRNVPRLEWNGIDLPIADWADLTGLPLTLIRRRMEAGMDHFMILSTPRHGRRRWKLQSKLPTLLKKTRGRPRVWPPVICRHESSGQARIRIAGRAYYLGPYGSEEAEKKYKEIVAGFYVEEREPCPENVLFYVI